MKIILSTLPRKAGRYTAQGFSTSWSKRPACLFPSNPRHAGNERDAHCTLFVRTNAHPWFNGSMKTILSLLIAVAVCGTALSKTDSAFVETGSLKEFREYLAKDNVKVRMKPGFTRSRMRRITIFSASRATIPIST